ncbi:ABC transporter permease [Paenibacillus sp. KS-LC4]|uniref:ABC transporter permease n=1 Tax=Paenibacillus sp. KS-LC4 TaxID=2979727 RepID=UPI0030CCB17B
MVDFLLFPHPSYFNFVASFSGEVKNRFLTYTRMRRQISKTLFIKLTANSILTFSFFFVLIFILFLFAFYIEPHLGIAKYDPEGYGLIKDTLAAETYTRRTFTQLLKFGTFTYGFHYSFWVGLNAALHSAIGFYLVLLVRNRFLALSLPFIFYVISSYALAALGLESYRLNYLIFPFDRSQDPIWTAIVPFAILVATLIALMLYVKRNTSKVDSMT